jgi:SAM-dependent methyltransferase
MPAAPPPRQASVADWFETSAAKLLERAQFTVLQRQLSQRPNWPVLWLSPAAGWLAERPAGARLICLERIGPRWQGDLECALPLPLASQGIGTVVLQHPCQAQAAQLLAECSRVLLPGGVLLLVVGRRLHPARLLCPRHALWASPAGGWRAMLAGNGLTLRGVHRIGPGGLQPQHACVVLEAEKRTLAPVGPTATRRLTVQVATRHSLKVT